MLRPNHFIKTLCRDRLCSKNVVVTKKYVISGVYVILRTVVSRVDCIREIYRIGHKFVCMSHKSTTARTVSERVISFTNKSVLGNEYKAAC